MTTVIENFSAKDKITSLLENFQGVAPASVKKLALEHLSAIDFPTIKNEEWKYTNTKPIFTHNFKPASSAGSLKKEQLESFTFSEKVNLVVFVNGLFSAESSILKDSSSSIYVGSLKDAQASYSSVIESHFGKYASSENEAFIALNTAYASDGAFVYISEKAALKYPVHLLFINDNIGEERISQPRVLIVGEKNSNGCFIESYHSTDEISPAFTNAVVEIVCKENSHLEHYKIQSENNSTYHISATQVYQLRDSRFNSHVLTFSGALVRNNLTSVLDDQGIESNLFGIYLPNGKQHVDNHTLVDHRKPHCNSNELYKGIVDENASAVFNGKIFVRKDAQKTNAFQSNKNILLSDTATIDSKPQLEIFADDVKCSHGSSTGQFDEDALFYMRARGIGHDQAKNLLMFAFASEILDTVEIPELKEYLFKLLSVRLNHDFS